MRPENQPWNNESSDSELPRNEMDKAESVKVKTGAFQKKVQWLVALVMESFAVESFAVVGDVIVGSVY